MKNFKKILLVLVLLLLPLTVSAKLFDSVKSGKITGEENGLRFNSGQSVEEEITNDGLTFLAGQNIKSKSSLTYGFYAGETVEINDTIEKDLFIAGQTVTIEGVLERDVFVAGQTVKVSANVGRNLYVGGEMIDLRGITINGDAKVAADKLLIDDDTIIMGKLVLNDDAKVDGKLDQEKYNIKYYKSEDYNGASASFRDRLASKVSDMATGFVILIALLYVASRSRERLHKIELDGPGYIMTAFNGLLFVFVAPIIIAISFIFVFTIPVALLALVAYIILVCVAELFGQYYVTRLLLIKFANNDSIPLAALSSVVAFGLIELIPYVGGIVSLLMFFFGVGLLFKTFKDSISKKDEPAVEIIEEKKTRKSTSKKKTED